MKTYSHRTGTGDCHECGRIQVECIIYTADYPEQETGYVDQYALCLECNDPMCQSCKVGKCGDCLKPCNCSHTPIG